MRFHDTPKERDAESGVWGRDGPDGSHNVGHVVEKVSFTKPFGDSYWGRSGM